MTSSPKTQKLVRPKYRSKASARPTAISLFSGAGGMDVGFIRAGFDVVWANDFNKNAVATYQENIGDHIVLGDINEQLGSLRDFEGVDCLFGGPPCQGFSVAGKMDLNDPRSALVKSFMKAVEIVRPRSFVMENVKALAKLEKFRDVRSSLIQKSIQMGYSVELLLLNSRQFGVPQSRERMFLVGFRDIKDAQISARVIRHSEPETSTLEAIRHLGPQGTEGNPKTCNAVVTIAERPVMRKSPYAGMLFNGLGRPLNPSVPCATLPASMGGNKTPIIDEQQFYGAGSSWVEWYHSHLSNGGAPLGMNDAPEFLRRLTLKEAEILHTFPSDYRFMGSKSSIYSQIGNAVPCNLARAVGMSVLDVFTDEPIPLPNYPQLEIPLVCVD